MFDAKCECDSHRSALSSFLSMRGPVAQRLEQRTHNPLVLGSNPSGPTNESLNAAFADFRDPLHSAALRVGDDMSIRVERRAKIRVAQQSLRGLDRLSYFREQRCMRSAGTSATKYVAV
jgi:hypothetical protein